ncbi:MAG TPA: hypothetical protein VFM18_04460 [Methanosarcina sp.]|nr:hypothetical protein [Methanosarcina sp.]
MHFSIFWPIFDESYGCGIGIGVGIVGGRAGEWGIKEGGADRIVRNRSMDGLAVSVAFRSMACPFLYTVRVRLSPTDLC